MSEGAEGGCLCGRIRYRLLKDAQRVTVCHCSFCQRATGSAYMIEPIFGIDDVEVLAGTPKVYDHRSEGSGKMVHVHFCADCGTKLLLTFERWPDLLGLYVGTLDQPALIPIVGARDKVIFLDAARADTIIPAGIATYRQHQATNDGTPNPATVYVAPQPVGPA